MLRYFWLRLAICGMYIHTIFYNWGGSQKWHRVLILLFATTFRSGWVCLRGLHTYIHACMHAYMHTCMQTYIHAKIHTFKNAYIHTCMHACKHTYMKTYIHAYRVTRWVGEKIAQNVPKPIFCSWLLPVGYLTKQVLLSRNMLFQVFT
jgi:hypothetical protein